MKKAKKLILFIMIVVILIVITISIVIVNKYNMQHYFDDWKPETDVNILHTIGRGYVEGMDLGKYINGRIEEVYCIKNKRIYFCYSTAVPDSYPNREWHIASVGITGEDFTEHYGGNLFSGSNPVGYSYEYLCPINHRPISDSMAASTQIIRSICTGTEPPSFMILRTEY